MKMILKSITWTYITYLKNNSLAIEDLLRNHLINSKSNFDLYVLIVTRMVPRHPTAD